jgi:uncharacterized membrane protein
VDWFKVKRKLFKKETGGEQMKKLSIMLAMLLVVCFAVSAVAEDRLSLSGAFRARAWYKDNLTTADSDDKSDRLQYWDSRFRVAAKIAIVEGITGNLRFDFSENTWGLTTNRSRRWQRGEAAQGERNFHVDRAYVPSTKKCLPSTWVSNSWLLENK